MLNYLRYIFSIQEDLLNRTLQNGPTDEFSLSERGRVRPITSLTTRDRIIRHVLCDDILLPEVKKKIIYDNGASIKGRGISHQRERFEVHLHRYYRQYGNEGWILFGDFSKFYDNIIHEIAKRELLKLFDDDEFIDWLLTVIFDGFKIDVSYMSDEEYASCMETLFNKLEYRNIPLSRFFPFAAFYRGFVRPIQIVGVTCDFFICHLLFTVIAILTVVNCIWLCHLSLLERTISPSVSVMIRNPGRTPLEFEALL